MKLIEKIFDKLNISFTWKGNKKKVIKQSGNGLQVLQDNKGTTNVFNIQNLNVSKIEQLAGIDPTEDIDNLLKSAGQRFLAEQKTKQENLKTAVEKANLLEIDNPQDVNQDWFLKWMEISQTVSRENVQDLLSKILSGEVKKSGSFSIRALEILKNLNKEELILFQKFCDISYHVPGINNSLTAVISEPFGSPGNNGMSSLGLSYSALTILQDAGLIKSDLNSWREFYVQTFQIPFFLGNTMFIFKQIEDIKETKKKIKIINFTNAGLELRSVMNIGNNKEYEDKFLSWIKDNFKLIPVS